MAEEVIENLDSPIEEIEEIDIFDESDDVETLKEKLEKSESNRKQLFERIKKAEALVKEKQVKPEAKVEKEVNDNLSQKDMFVLIKANVHEDDILEITDYAKMKGISVADAMKTSIVKTILSEREEERETALNTATGNTRRGASKPNPAQLLEKAQKGELPEGKDDMDALVKAQFERK